MSRIPWCDETWNPVTGCSRGCSYCYARKFAETRLRGRFGYPADDPFRAGTVHFDKFKDPLKWKQPKTIFVCSMGDLFDEEVMTVDVANVFKAAQFAPQHTYIFLTKNPRRMTAAMSGFFRDKPKPANWYLGVTVTCQNRADCKEPGDVSLEEAAPSLAQLAAAGWQTFISLEPMRGPVDLSSPIPHTCGPQCNPARLIRASSSFRASSSAASPGRERSPCIPIGCEPSATSARLRACRSFSSSTALPGGMRITQGSVLTPLAACPSSTAASMTPFRGPWGKGGRHDYHP